MNTVRTTIVMDAALHRQLLIQAAQMGVGFSDLVNRKLGNPNAAISPETISKMITKQRTLFRALGRKAGKTDWARLVREERGRDSG